MIRIELTAMIMLIVTFAVGVVCGIMWKMIKDAQDGKGGL